MRDVLATALEKLAARLRRRATDPAQLAVPELLALTPHYERTLHGVYFDVIEVALLNTTDDIRNIALTGSYGVGKSSILQEVARKHKKSAISVSLSTLGFVDEPASSAAQQKSSSKTNQIQKEIVKQLLYSQDPVRMPGSRYRRTTRFRAGREVGLAALFAAPLTVVFLLAGWTASIAKVIVLPAEVALLIHLIVFIALGALVFGLRLVLHNRIQIDQLSAGAATITLSPKSATYFDEYLDEIVYFFEVVDRDIIIFEDIDRFDDAHIFETLRSLNSILNGANQLKGRRVRFIYAIKDSIFDELGERAAKEELPDDDDGSGTDVEIPDAAESELARANRTKFFDLVIPVVPFITHRSARDLLVSTMGEIEHDVSSDLIDLTARHIADMRLIKNIRNEFAIFKNRVIDPGTIELKQTKLFAMVLYKSTHLSDFERIKLGKSDLDDLYRVGRELVNENIRALNLKITKARRELLSLRPIAGREKQLGDALSAHIDLLTKYTGLAIVQMTYAGAAVSVEDFQTPEFWSKYVGEDQPIQITYRTGYGYNTPLTLTRVDVQSVVKDALTAEGWRKTERDRINGDLGDHLADREFLTRADMGALADRDEFKLTKDGTLRSFSELAKLGLKSELALQLVANGYIDRNFTLYTSTFHDERVSANATNFILKNVDPNVIDINFPLTSEDVEALLREGGRSILREQVAFNITFMDYLLESEVAGAKTVIEQLMKVGDDQKEFLQSYVETGAKKDELVQHLAGTWPRIFDFLISEASLDEDDRTHLIDLALSSATEVKYLLSEDVRDYLRTGYKQLKSLTSDETPESTAAIVASIFEKAGASIDDLAALGLSLRPAFVEVGAFDLTRPNLLIALNDEKHSLSLDAIKTSDEFVYERVLQDLPTYRSTVGEKTPTIRNPDAFISIIGDVLDADPSFLPALVGGADPTCLVADLNGLSTETWEALATAKRFPVTFTNVDAYVTEFGIDDRLAGLLSAGETIVMDDEDATEEAKSALALQIIGAVDELSSPSLRASLAQSLGMKNYIPAASIGVEPGELIGSLIEKEIIADDASSFSRIAATDINGRAFAISKSDEFISFMTTTEVPVSIVGQLVSSSLVPNAVKDALLSRFAEFTAGATRAALSLVAYEAVRRDATVPLQEVARLADENVAASIVIPLLQKHLPAITLGEIVAVLTPLGGEYRKLTERNGKHPRVTNDPAHLALIHRLQDDDIGLVNSPTITEREIRAHMKKS